MKRWLYLLLIIAFGWRCKGKKEGVVYFNNDSLIVEIAKTPKELEKGLMGRKSLPEDRGMLFIFEREGIYPFWMKNTSIPLSIAFIDKDCKIVQIEDMEPFDTISLYTPFSPIKYALEVNRGWFKRHNIKIGSSLSFSIP